MYKLRMPGERHQNPVRSGVLVENQTKESVVVTRPDRDAVQQHRLALAK